ncbi:MAG: hypothetical protein ACP5D9_13065 [Mariniphaga sp.]
MESIISTLNKISKDYISADFIFHKKESFLYVNSDNNISQAINIRKNDSQQVNVSNWFDDIWLYIELRYIPKQTKSKKVIPNIFFSLSVFQGEADDVEKNQLFRAEWDNYDNLSNNHPQPHWHFYTRKDIKDLKKTFTELIESSEDSFEDFIKSDREIVDIEKFHFAMNGQWSVNNSDVHKISSEGELTNWFAGILNHIKKELEYLKVK